MNMPDDRPVQPDHLDLADIAGRHGVSPQAVGVLLEALRRGGFHQAQFSHPDLGGMGQWSSGGMCQVGDMFNASLRDRVAALCRELSQTGSAAAPAVFEGHATHGVREAAKDWWPDGLGRPSATGAQNGMRYACFPEARRVAIEQAGVVTIYDSGDHRIGGVSQSQSSTTDLVFSSQHGSLRASDLQVAME
jgi:hypothetical protein